MHVQAAHTRSTCLPKPVQTFLQRSIHRCPASPLPLKKHLSLVGRPVIRGVASNVPLLGREFEVISSVKSGIIFRQLAVAV